MNSDPARSPAHLDGAVGDRSVRLLGTWAQMRRGRPALFDRAADLEELLTARRAELGKDPVYLTRLRGLLLRAGRTRAANPGPAGTDRCATV